MRVFILGLGANPTGKPVDTILGSRPAFTSSQCKPAKRRLFECASRGPPRTLVRLFDHSGISSELLLVPSSVLNTVLRSGELHTNLRIVAVSFKRKDAVWDYID